MSLNKFILKDIECVLSKNGLSIYNKWIAWLKNQKNYSPHTINAYSLDFKYFINFLSHHFEKKEIGIELIKELKLLDFRSWLSFLSSNHIKLSSKSSARARASIKSFISYWN